MTTPARPVACCIHTNSGGGDSGGAGGTGGTGGGMTCTMTMPQVELSAGKVVSIQTIASSASTDADCWFITIQPQGTTGSAHQVDALWLPSVAANRSGVTGVPRVNTWVYFLQVGDKNVCLGSQYTSETISQLPPDAQNSALRSTGLRITNIESDGSNTAGIAPQADHGLMQDSGMLVSGASWWQTPPAYSSGQSAHGTPAHATGLAALDAVDLPFNEIAIQSKRADQSSDTGGVSIYGQDFISQSSRGSIASTAIGNITTSANGPVHIESSSSISLQVGESGLTITSDGIVLTQNKAADFGMGVSLALSPTSIKAYAPSVNLSSLISINLSSLGSKLELVPLQATLSAMATVKCVSGWVNYASVGSLAALLPMGAIKIGIKAGDTTSTQLDVEELSWGLLDTTMGALGIQTNFETGTSWRMNKTLPSADDSDGWLAWAIGMGSIVAGGALAGDLMSLTVRAKSSGFVAKGNEAYMLGGYYLPGLYQKLMPRMGGAAALDKIKKANQAAGIPISEVPLPVVVDPEEGHCLMLASNWQECRTSLVGIECEASVATLTRLTSSFGPLLPLLPLMTVTETAIAAGGAACASMVRFAASRMDAFGTWASSLRGTHKVTTEETGEVSGYVSLAPLIEEAAATRAAEAEA
ncbi:MAG: hypothetical protein MK101_03810 [Phycisphaerales bacterium]|nr:hypothetical protein [Phycisphaerales bacterium]